MFCLRSVGCAASHGPGKHCAHTRARGYGGELGSQRWQLANRAATRLDLVMRVTAGTRGGGPFGPAFALPKFTVVFYGA